MKARSVVASIVASAAFVVVVAGAVRANDNAAIVVDHVVIAVDDSVEQAAHVDVLNKRIAASNAHDWATWQSLHVDGCVRTGPELATPLVSSDAMRDAIAGLVDVFPDYTLGVVRVVGHGEWMATTLTSTATLPTGARFSQTWTAFVRFDGNKIAEWHEHYDQLDVVAQLLGASRPRAL